MIQTWKSAVSGNLFCRWIEIKLNRVLADYFVNSFHWIKSQLSNSNFSLYFWPILTKVLNYEPVVLRITAMKFWFCGIRIFHWLLHFFPSFESQFWLFVIVKNKLRSVFYSSVLLLMINFVITLSKFVVDPLACIYNTLTMLWRNLSSIRGQTHKKLTLIC